jgi:hypothetical protein
MVADWVPGQVSFDPHGGRILDTARGILIGLRRCPSEAALHELLSAAQRHKVPVFAMAWALVHLANGGEKLAHTFTDAQSAARYEWGQLFGDVRCVELLTEPGRLPRG